MDTRLDHPPTSSSAPSLSSVLSKPPSARESKRTITPSAAISASVHSGMLTNESAASHAINLIHADADHRPSQPFPGAAPSHAVQRSPSLNNGQANQPLYPLQGVYHPQAGIASPYLNHPTHYPQQQQPPGENQYYAANPSPRSTNSGAYYAPDKADNMAAATATMQRPPYPPIYHTPQSNSPASVTSPHNDQGRPIYQPPQLTQSMYAYPNYQAISQVHHPSAYGSHPNPHGMSSQPMLSYPPNANQMSHGQMSGQPGGIQSSPRLKQETSQQYSQTSANQAAIQHRLSTTGPPSAPGMHTSHNPAGNATSNAAPGPIPATTPLVVRQDQNGVQWIAFEYSRDRVKMEYTIRCDVESVDANNLTSEFKSENCVYPRACVPKDQYKGNRLAYETDCNQVGWALADLNPCLRGKRGLIQRAVDSWRNSNSDPRLRSRRVRRQAKLHNRSKIGGPPPPPSSSAVSMQTGLSSSNHMGAPLSRPSNALSQGSQPVHHHQIPSSSGQDSLAGASTYSTTPSLHRSSSANQHMPGQTDLRQAHSFPGYQTYPSAPTSLGPSMAPPIQGGMHHYGRTGGTASMAREKDDVEQGTDLFGDVPEGKKRKFIVVQDEQADHRVRVKATLDQIEVSEIPDSYRKTNSVFPRAYYPVQMQAASPVTSGSRFVEEDAEEADEAPPIAGRMTVPCQTSDGEGEIDVSQLSKGKRSRERKINELGYRMAWGQSRVFSNRPIFLSRALDAYRNKVRATLATTDDALIPSHLETRPGKRRWNERMRPHETITSPPAPSSV